MSHIFLLIIVGLPIALIILLAFADGKTSSPLMYLTSGIISAFIAQFILIVMGARKS